MNKGLSLSGSVDSTHTLGGCPPSEAVPVTVDVDQERSNSSSYHTRMPSRPTVVVLSVRLRRARYGPARSASMHVAGPGGDQTERDGVLTEVCSTVVWSGVLCVRWK